MYDLINEAIKVLAPWPLAQMIMISLVAGLGIVMMRKSDRDRKNSDDGKIEPPPLWSMMGPVHEAIQAIHDMAEESRKANATHREIFDTISDIHKTQIYIMQILEDIRNDKGLTPPNTGTWDNTHPRRRKPP
jgi:hypothetical protein